MGLKLPKSAKKLLHKYTKTDNANLNSKVSLLYAIYVILTESNYNINKLNEVPTRVFERLFDETLLNLSIDYREIWLLENSLCLLVEYYFRFCTESKI